MTEIFVDIDGVVGDFDNSVKSLFGSYPKELGDDVLWPLIVNTPNFWRNLPLMEDAMILWEAVRDHNPIFLTGCPKSDYERAEQDKRWWVRHHFGDVPVITCLSREKPMHMRQQRDILIDDFMSNIKRWEKAGGRAIYHLSAEQTIPRFRHLMAD